MDVDGRKFSAGGGPSGQPNSSGSFTLDLAAGEVFTVTASAQVTDFAPWPFADSSSRAEVTASWAIIDDVTIAAVPGLAVAVAIPFEEIAIAAEPIEPLTILKQVGTSNVIRYDYTADTGLFSEFILPDQILGTTSDVQLSSDGFTETATTETPIDFTQFVAEGISEFSLTIDNAAGLLDPNGLSPFVVGVKMADNGVAGLRQTVNSDGAQTVEGYLSSPIYEELGRTGFLYIGGNVVPEPSTLTLAALGLLGLAMCRHRKR